jgi:enoyl-CoA hydratase
VSTSEGSTAYAGYRAVQFHRSGPILRVVIDHPDSALNVVDELLHGELTRMARDLRDEQDARVIVLTAAGDAFSAGGDLGWFPRLRSVEALARLQIDARSLVLDFLDIPTPVIAALPGPAVGLGATIALLCDGLIMADTATLADPHVSVGLVAGDGGTAVWPLVLGPSRAKQYLLTGAPVDASAAVAMGLATHVVTPDQLDDAATALAERIAAQPPLAVRYTKLAVNKLIREAVERTLDAAAGYELLTFLSEDHVEAVEAFTERRPGRYEGR